MGIILHSWFTSKFAFRKLSTLLFDIFLIKPTFFEPNEHFFQKLESSLKVLRVKEKLSDNLGHVLELYNVLVQFRFATSKTKLGI